MRNILIIIFAFASMIAQAQMPTFKPEDQPKAPDYSKAESWAALPFQKDEADFHRSGEPRQPDSLKAADVFYIYPTMYREGEVWCADIYDKKLNKTIDKKPIRYQASVFNGVGRIYAPRYRQAILKSFTDTSANGAAALQFAYEDVKRAFEYYMQHHNNGRPIILASHSQGTFHARRLLADYFDKPEMKEKLVCAYVVGFGIYPDWYELLTPCENPKETNCYVTWASFKEGHDRNLPAALFGDVCVNPISWTRDTTAASSNGSLLLNLQRRKPYACQARIKDNFLWVDTSMPVVNKWRVLHTIDYNLFWMDIRKNVALRVEEYLKK